MLNTCIDDFDRDEMWMFKSNLLFCNPTTPVLARKVGILPPNCRTISRVWHVIAYTKSLSDVIVTCYQIPTSVVGKFLMSTDRTSSRVEYTDTVTIVADSARKVQVQFQRQQRLISDAKMAWRKDIPGLPGSAIEGVHDTDVCKRGNEELREIAGASASSLSGKCLHQFCARIR